MGLVERAGERLDSLRFVAVAVDELLHLSLESALVHERAQLVADLASVLSGRRPDVEVEHADLGVGEDHPRLAAADRTDVHARDDGAAGRLVAMLLLVLERPLLEPLEQRHGAEDRVRLVLPRVRTVQERRVERRPAEDRELVERLTGFDPTLAEARRFGAQTEGRTRRMVEEIPRAEVLAQVPLALELVHRLLADLAG